MIEVKYFRTPPGGSHAPLTDQEGQFFADIVKVARRPGLEAAPVPQPGPSASGDPGPAAAPPVRLMYVVAESGFARHLQRHYPEADVFHLPLHQRHEMTLVRGALPPTAAHRNSKVAGGPWERLRLSFTVLYRHAGGLPCAVALVRVEGVLGTVR